MTLLQSYDFVIVGAGSAGALLAGRLAEDASIRVLLIEAGTGARHPLIRVPLAWHPASETPRFTWGYRSAPEPATQGRALDQPRGRIMGGSASINGMMYSRGQAADYDGWAADGLAGWSYFDLLPYFRRTEANWRGASTFHGGSGPLCVARNPAHPILYPAMIAAARRLGFVENDDFNGTSQDGFGMPDFTVRRGERESSATAFLSGARTRSNLHIATKALVTNLRFDGRRAVGLDLYRQGQLKHVAAGEIILSAGAFNSPKLLMLAGIGDPGALTEAGIKPWHDLPAVGRNLQDHPLVPMGFGATGALGFERLMRLDRLVRGAARWALTGGGPLGEAPLSVQGYLRLSEDSKSPDTQFQVSHVSFQARPWFPGWRSGAGDQFTVSALQLRPTGRGNVTLRSADPAAPPVIRLGLLSTDTDRAHARAMVRFTRRFMRTDPVADFVGAELFPGADCESDAAIDGFLAGAIQTGMHPTSSCAMGVDPAHSVVDARLRVHGIDGLRVVDTSIMPRIVSGNTSAPAMMIAEKAADLLLLRAAGNAK